MKKLLEVFTLSIFLIACSNNDANEKDQANNTNDNRTKRDSLSNMDYFKLDADSITIMPFEIEISLSPKAADRIKNGRETIIVAVFLQGTPKDSSTAKFAEDGSFFVGSASKEIVYGETARIDNLKYPREIFDQLADKDVDLSVNVFSGRKSSPDNLLDCEGLFDKVSKVANNRFTLKGKLIYGDD